MSPGRIIDHQHQSHHHNHHEEEDEKENENEEYHINHHHNIQNIKLDLKSSLKDTGNIDPSLSTATTLIKKSKSLSNDSSDSEHDALKLLNSDSIDPVAAANTNQSTSSSTNDVNVGQLRKMLPAKVFEKNLMLSMLYLVLDVFVISLCIYFYKNDFSYLTYFLYANIMGMCVKKKKKKKKKNKTGIKSFLDLILKNQVSICGLYLWWGMTAAMVHSPITHT